MFLHLFSRLRVVEFFEQLHLHGVADFVVFGGEEVEEGGEDALAKDDDHQVEAEDKCGQTREAREEKGKKSDFQIHIWNFVQIEMSELLNWLLIFATVG